MKSILLILIVYSFGFSEYIRDNGVVKDTTTNLYWQDDYSDNGGDITYLNWNGALTYCNNLELGGYNDWRLPNIVELISIVDDTKYYPSISEVFQNTKSSNYWSSTSRSYNSDDAWFIFFYIGFQYYKNKSYDYFVRCVRVGE